MKQKKVDNVNHPPHYTWLKDKCGIEVIDITRHMDFCLGNAIKYILRAGHKQDASLTDNQKEIEDLKKAIWYINDRIKQLGGEIHFKDGHRETYNNRYDKELEYYNRVLDDWNNPKGIVPAVVRPKYDLEFKDFFIPLQDCIERDSKRPNPIGEEVIRKTYEKYKDILKV